MTSLKALKKFLLRYYWFIIIILFVALRLPSLFEPYWYGDEGIYLAIGQGLRSGLKLYSQIHDNKPPLLYYFAALGNTVFGFRLLLSLVMIPTLYYFYRLAQKFLTQHQSQVALFIFLLLTSIPLLEGNIANAEVFMLLPTILAVLLFLQPKSNYSYLYVGLLLGIAFSIKVPVAIEVAFLGLWLLLNLDTKKISQNIIKIIFFALAFIFPTIIFGIYYALQGSFDNFLFAALLNNFGYLSSWSSGTHSSSALSGGLGLRLVLLLLTWLILTYLKLRKIIKDKHLFILFWFSAAIFGSLLSGRPYPHYLIQLLPSLSLILVLLFDSHLRSVKLIYLSMLIILTASLVKYNFYFYPVFSYYQNFYSYALRLKSSSQYTSFFGNRIDNNQEISDYIKQNSSPSDTIFVWGDEPYVYPLSDRLPAARFLVAYHIVDFNKYSEVYDNLITKTPKFIVVYPMSNRPYPQLDYLLKNYYSPVKTSEDIVIYQLR